MTGMNVTLTELLELAGEALQRAGYKHFQEGHPEDMVAALVPALEAVAVGYSEGYRRGRADMKRIIEANAQKGTGGKHAYQSQ